MADPAAETDSVLDPEGAHKLLEAAALRSITDRKPKFKPSLARAIAESSTWNLLP